MVIVFRALELDGKVLVLTWRNVARQELLLHFVEVASVVNVLQKYYENIAVIGLGRVVRNADYRADILLVNRTLGELQIRGIGGGRINLYG